MRYLHAAVAIAATFSFLAWGTLGLTLQRQSQAVPMADLTRHLAQVISNAAKTTAQISQIATAWQGREEYQAQQMNGILHEARQTLMEARRSTYQINTVVLPQLVKAVQDNSNALAGFVKNTDRSLNGEALPQLSRSIAATQQQVATLSLGLADSQRKFSQLTADLDSIVADPKNKETLAHLDVTMANVQDISKHADNMIARLDAPRRFWTAIASAVISAGAKAGSIVAGFVK